MTFNLSMILEVVKTAL